MLSSSTPNGHPSTPSSATPGDSSARPTASFLGGLDNKKVLLAGSSRAGKSCLVHRYMTDAYPSDANGAVVYRQTLGADLAVKYVVEGEHRVALSLWCLAGHPRYRASLVQFFTDDVAVVLVAVDLLHPRSLDEAAEWVAQAKEMCPTALIYLCGTKADEVDKIVYKMPDLTRAARDAGAVAFKTTSAKTGAGIRELFEEVCVKLRDL
ncbi:Ras- protein Rab-34 [Blastocladiella emersonii ATCC 22665]|nr:Ras- protein Rab-34 [Blastocladiella emersonii ATCC 22665]